jgi:nucleotide-binding universal stress UspA family protein
MMFEKVLVCLDGSALAEQILPYIVGDSKKFKKVVLLKVIAAPGIDIPLGVPGENPSPLQTKSMLDHKQKELEETPDYLESKAESLRKIGLKVECVVLEGIPKSDIVKYAHDNNIGLIAIATHGHSGIRAITMGSTAEYVLKHSGLPMLMVTPQKPR